MASGHRLVFLALKFPKPVPDARASGGTVGLWDGAQGLADPALCRGLELSVSTSPGHLAGGESRGLLDSPPHLQLAFGWCEDLTVLSRLRNQWQARE